MQTAPEKSQRSPSASRYDVFISYSHAQEKALAATLQKTLENYARPLFKQRTMRVFRDETNLAANPDLWHEIEGALDASGVLLLLASRKAAQSQWIPREVQRFVERCGPRAVCVALAEGITPWTERAPVNEVLDREECAVSREVYELLAIPDAVPLLIDLSSFVGKSEAELLNSPEFQNNVASIAARVLGKDKDTLYGEHISRQRKIIRITAGAAFILLVAAIVAVVSAVQASRERDRALRQARANAAYALSEQDPTMAIQFAESAIGKDSNTAANLALIKAFNTGSWFYSHRFDDAISASLSHDGLEIAWIDSKLALHLTEVATQKTVTLPALGHSSVHFLSSGHIAAWHGWDGPGSTGELAILDASGATVRHHRSEFLRAVPCLSGSIMVPAFGENRRIVVHVLDPRVDGERAFTLPEQVAGLGSHAICLPGGNGLIVTQPLPSVVAGADLDGNSWSLELPPKYHSSDIDLDANHGRVAIYLAGAVRGTSDALGWFELDPKNTTPPTIKIIPLPMSPGFDSGGRVHFLLDGRVIAASTDGWTRLIDLDDETPKKITDRSRATDQIAVSPGGAMFVLARRSGVATIYTQQGIPIGQLLGESHSDGLNPAFKSMSFDDAESMILTSSSTGARLWRRPRYDLTLPHSETFKPFDEIPSDALTIFKALGGKSDPGMAEGCKGTELLRIDNAGRMNLCVRVQERIDSLSTGLLKGDLDISGNGPVEGTGHRFVGEDADRLFVLSPEMILDLVREERTLGRLWQLDEKMGARWTN